MVLTGALGSAAIRSAGGSMLKTGKMAEGFKEVKPIWSKMEKLLGKDVLLAGLTYKSIQKMLDVVSKSSPAFKQQMIVLQKSLLLFIRPIGDIMAKFVRPAAIWSLKMARTWYNALTGQKSGELEKGGAGAEDIADKIKQLEVEKQTKVESGDFLGAEAVDKLIEDIQSKEIIDKTIFDPVQNLFQDLFDRVFPGFNDVLTQSAEALWALIPETLLGLWDSMKESGLALWEALTKTYEVFQPFIKAVWDLTKIIAGSLILTSIFILIGAFKVLTFVLKGISITVDLFKVALTYLLEWLEHVREYLGGAMLDAWNTLYDGMIKLGSWIKDTFLSAWNSLTTAIQSLWDKLEKFTAWVSKLKFWGKGDEKASGGYIDKTGLYTLHAGERVLNAGDTSRSTSNTTMNVTTPITIQATINNDIDIRQLAQRLSDYQETEIRRRISYI